MKYNPLLGDPDGFIEKNKNLVPFMYKRFKNSFDDAGIEKEDALQEGYLAMCKAYEKYNGKTKSSTYMVNCIKNKFLTLLDATNTESRTVYKLSSSLDEIVGIGEDLTVHDVIGDKDDLLVSECKIIFNNELDRYIIDMLSKGESQAEISRRAGVYVTTVQRHVRRMREKIIQAV